MTHWDDGDWENVPPTVPTTPQPTVIIPDPETPELDDDGEVDD